MFKRELDYLQTIEAQHLMGLFVVALGVAAKENPGAPLTQKQLEILWIDKWAQYLLHKTTS